MTEDTELKMPVLKDSVFQHKAALLWAIVIDIITIPVIAYAAGICCPFLIDRIIIGVLTAIMFMTIRIRDIKIRARDKYIEELKKYLETLQYKYAKKVLEEKSRNENL